MKSQGQRGGGFKWKRPEGVSEFSCLPRMRWSVDDPDTDVHSDNQRKVYKHLERSMVWSTGGEVVERVARGQSYTRISRACGFEPKTAQRAIYALIRKGSIAAWDDAQKIEVTTKTGLTAKGKPVTPTGRVRGVKGFRRCTSYYVVPAADALARRRQRFWHWLEENKDGELKARWLTIGEGRRILTMEECSGPPQGWNADEYAEHRKQVKRERAERDARRVQREHGMPPAAVTRPDAPVPDEPEATRKPPTSTPAGGSGQRSTEESQRSAAPADRGLPPTVIHTALRSKAIASNIELWNTIDKARAAASDIGWSISDDEIAQIIRIAHGRTGGKQRNGRWYTVTVADLIESNPQWKPPEPAARREETTEERIERLAYWIGIVRDTSFQEFAEEARAHLKAADAGELRIATELYENEQQRSRQRKVEALLQAFRDSIDHSLPSERLYRATVTIDRYRATERELYDDAMRAWKNQSARAG